MSIPKIRVEDLGNHKTSIHMKIDNIGDITIDVSAFYKNGVNNEDLRIGFDNGRMKIQTVEIEPNDNTLLSIAPPDNRSFWKSKETIILKFTYGEKIHQCTYITGNQQQRGRFVESSETIPSYQEKDNPEESQEKDDLKEHQKPQESQEKDNPEESEKLEISDLKNIIDRYEQFRAKVDESTKRVSSLRESYTASKKRTADIKDELDKEELEFKTAIKIQEQIEQQFKKIKTTVSNV
jgi:hypothetical protein